MRSLARVSVVGAIAVLALTGGCSWFQKKKPAPVAEVAALPTPGRDVQPASAARAACANYAEVAQDSPFPRDAIIRGIDAGSASVRFRVEDTKISVLSVTSSNPAFGDAAADIVRRLQCRVDRPTDFEVPFSWRTTR